MMCTDTYVDSLIAKAKKAQNIVEDYTQQQIDLLVKSIGKTIYDHAELLAREAVEETGYGSVESKTWKQRKSCMAAWYYLKEKASVGMIDEDPMNGLITYAKPVGVVACLTPSTNPTSTVASNGMNIIKCRNAMVVAPHPKAKNSTMHGVVLINERLKALGAPENLIQIMQEPTMAATKELMSKADIIVATGGASMVKSAYSSGKPSYGVGQGNVQSLIADDYQDVEFVAKTIINNRSYDNGMPCTCEQAVYIPAKKRAEYLEAFQSAGAYLLDDETNVLALRALLFREDGSIDPAYVGMPAIKIAEKISVSVAADTKVILVKAHGKGHEDVLCKEKLCPVLLFYTYDDFSDAVEIAKANLLMEGAGHTVTLYTNDQHTARFVGAALPVGRVMINQSGATASGGSLINGLPPTLSLGCGSWGNNSISENLTYKHLMNTTRVVYPREDFIFPSPEQVWGSF